MMFGGSLQSALSKMVRGGTPGINPEAPQPMLGATMMPQQPRGLGAKLGDFVLNYAAGMGSPIAQMTLQERSQGRLAQQQAAEWDRRQQAERAAANQDWIARQTWERANPAAAQPTEFERTVRAAGYAPGSPEYTAIMRQRAESQANPTQWLQATDPTTGVRSIIPVSRGGMPGAQPAGPPEGAIAHLRQNPSLAAAFDQKYGAGASQRILGGAPSQGGATFP